LEVDNYNKGKIDMFYKGMESLNSKYQIFDIYDNVQKEIKKKYK
jgi:hypothetical protein